MFILFTETDLDRLERAVLDTLSDVGVLVQDKVIRAALAAAGAIAGGPDEPVRLPRALVQRVIEGQRTIQAAAGGPGTVPRITASANPPTIGLYTHVAQFFFDWDRHERRAPTEDDFLFCLRFGDVHCPAAGVSQMLILREHPPLLQNLEALFLILRHANRVGASYLHYGEQVPCFAEIGRIWAGDPRRFLHACIFAATPLRYDRRACGVMRAMAAQGISSPVGTMVTSGASAPVTPAGAVVVGAAELLAGMVMQHALGAPAPHSAGIATGSLDLRAANSDFASPEAMLQDIGIRELFERRFGGHAGIWGRSDYTCARLPGIQAAYERSFEGLWNAVAGGGQPFFGSGLLESGKTLCLEQLLLDEEVAAMHWRVARGLPVTDETIALPDILAVGVGRAQTHLATDHTLRHMREAWTPALFDRGVWDDAREREREAAMLARAHRQVAETAARYQPPSPDPGKLRAVRAVIDCAAREHPAGDV